MFTGSQFTHPVWFWRPKRTPAALLPPHINDIAVSRELAKRPNPTFALSKPYIFPLARVHGYLLRGGRG